MNRGLASWFAIGHPRYRATLVLLFAVAVVAAGLAYLQNDLLRLLTHSLAAAPAGASASSAAPAGRPVRGLGLVSDVAVRVGLSVPLVILGVFVLARIAAAAAEFVKTLAGARLQVRSYCDLESAILMHLLARDDAFFSRHSPAETVNRLAVDLRRVSDRRTNVLLLAWSALVLSGNLVFFFLKDWRLATVALGACLAAALWTRHMIGKLTHVDSDYLEQDDRVKAAFEELLRAAPEVTVGRFHARVRQYFDELQTGRNRPWLQLGRVGATLAAGRIVSALLAFVAMIAVVLYLRHAGAASSALALVPVVIWALPALFDNTAQLGLRNLNLRLARNSVRRLLEYEGHEMAEGPAATTILRPAARPAPPTAPPDSIALDGATYRYAGPDRRPQGGVVEVRTVFTPGRWTAIVGTAGSGKSTLLRLALGGLKPQRGAVRYGSIRLDDLPSARLAAARSLLPQTPALLDTSIRRNLLFGRPAEPGAAPRLSDDDLAVVHGTGLAELCHRKALDMAPASAPEAAALGDRIAELRARVRQRLRDRCGTGVLPYEAGHAHPRHWLVECLTASRCDRSRAAKLLVAGAAERRLRAACRGPLGEQLIAAARGALANSSRLLGVADFGVFCRLAPFPLPRPLWELRVARAPLAQRQHLSPDGRLALCTIGLTSCPAELAGEAPAAPWLGREAREQFAAEAAALRDLLGEACCPLAAGRMHPYLTWRENLVFGVLEGQNSRALRAADGALLELLVQEGLGETLTRVGLAFRIGRLGGNLSPGQGQLVALCRALLRRTPILALDEPVSALDPAGRARVAEFLRCWKADRIVLTVSHDPAFVRAADDIRVLDRGRLVASGTYDELARTCEPFRRTLRAP